MDTYINIINSLSVLINEVYAVLSLSAFAQSTTKVSTHSRNIYFMAISLFGVNFGIQSKIFSKEQFHCAWYLRKMFARFFCSFGTPIWNDC